MKKNILIIQPGRNGDIIICLPIAKYYHDMGFEVEWLCPEEYHINFRNINYCKPITNLSKHYYEVIDLSFGFGGSPELWWELTKPRWDSFVTAKYYLSRVPLEQKWNLIWDRNMTRELELCEEIEAFGDYLIYHEEGSNKNFNLKINSNLKKIKFNKIKDYNIFDWYQVLMNSKEIHCVDSFLCNFVDSAINGPKKIFYDVRNSSFSKDRTLIKNWEII